MGYKEFPDNDILETTFSIIKVYSLRGLSFESDCEDKKSEAVSLSDSCTVAIAQSVNEASKILTGYELVDDEEKWLLERKTCPPFLLIYFKGREIIKLNGGYRQEIEDYIETYNAFPEKKEIKEWEENSLPGIVTSLTVNLSNLDRLVELVPVEHSVFGITKDGITLFDSKITGHINISQSYQKSTDQINVSLNNSTRLLPFLHKDVCRNFYAALNEPDRLKQFLGYFQFLERYTHITYKTLSFDNNVKAVFNIPERINEPCYRFFKDIFSESKNLAQRFHWCAILTGFVA